MYLPGSLCLCSIISCSILLFVVNPETSCRILLGKVINMESESVERTDRVVIYGAMAGAAPALKRHILDTAKRFDIKRGVDLCTNSGFWKEAFFGLKPVLGSDQKPTIPGLVIVSGGIRQYDPWNGNSMTIDSFSDLDTSGRTFFDHVSNLCDQWGVPIIKNNQEPDDFPETDDFDDDSGIPWELDDRDDDS